MLQGWWHCILYVLFENAMGMVKLWAVIAGKFPEGAMQLWSVAVTSIAIWLMGLPCSAGLLDLEGAKEWVVTTKLGSSDKRPGTQV